MINHVVRVKFFRVGITCLCQNQNLITCLRENFVFLLDICRYLLLFYLLRNFLTYMLVTFICRQFMLVLLSGDKSGRLMKYDKSTKEVKVLLSGLAFPNGVALNKDGSFLLVAETSTCRILRLWLHGPKAGQVDTFAILPGFPDNVRRNSEGQFWVALHAKETPFAKWMSSNLWAGKALSKLGNFKWLHASLAMKPHAAAIKLSDEGEILEVLEDCEGKTLKFISEIEEKDGKLWMASVLMPYIGVYSL